MTRSSEHSRDITELKAVHDLLQSVLDGLSTSIAVLDGAGAILSVNRSWKFFGEANGLELPDHGVGTNYLSLCEAAQGPWSEEAAAAAAGIREVLAGSRPVFQLEYPCHDPQVQRWFVMRATATHGSSPGHAIVAHEDITHRKQAELRLRASEERFRRLAEDAGVGIGFFDLGGRARYFNRVALERLSGTVERWAGLTATELFGPEWGGHIATRFREVAATRTPREYEDCVDLGGGRRWYLSNYSPVCDDSGQVIGVQILSNDITDRRAAEAALRESEEKYRQLFENETDAVMVFDAETLCFTEANAATLALFGYTRQEFLGSPVSGISAEPDEPPMRCSGRRRTQEGIRKRS